jgi:hypothetical protein
MPVLPWKASSLKRALRPQEQRVWRLDLVQLIFELIDMRSFSNLWYWIALGVIWSSASHWVLGVPHDMIQRARREGAEALDDMQTLVRINVKRLLYIARASGVALLAFLCFILTTLGLLAFVYDVEFAQAVLFIFVPLAILGALSLRTAGLIENSESEGDALFRRLFRHRLATQVLGMISIFVTSLFGMWQNLQINISH